ncbi:MAG: TIGR00266 family protein [Bacteroidales bacterium]|nr:TIGR00266 family protein [Bacteroidales bacterium]MBN2817603.1 TIGR00266 family protein [Bacteroidales bacterium]
MQSHKIDYQIKGHDVQLVEIELDPQETVIAEAGAMIYMDDGINFTARMGDGSEPNEGLFGKLLKGASRVITGESLFLTHFTNSSYGKKHVAFSAPYPGTIVPFNLPDFGGSIIVQRETFLCAAMGTKVSIHLNKKIGAGLFGGEGFILQKLQGDGLAFGHAGGTVIERELKGDSLFVDTGCIVGFTTGIDFSISQAGGMRSMLFGGEGIFLAHLKGNGKIWLQSMPIRKLIQAIAPAGRNAGKEQAGGLLRDILDSSR